MNTFYQMWGVKPPEEVKQKIKEHTKEADISSTPRNLEEKAISLIGTDIYEKLIKGYTEKQWGKKAKELPASIIQRIPIRFTFDNNYFNHQYQVIPEDGYTSIFENLLSNKNIDVKLSQDFLVDKDTFLSEFPRIIYTGTIDGFYNYELGNLDYRSLTFETFSCPSNNVQGNAVMNFTDSQTPYTRVMEWRHFDGKGNDGISYLTREYPQNWDQTKEAYYPINDSENMQLYKRYESLSKKIPNVIFVGRLGKYQYYDMDQTVRAALICVKSECRAN